RQALMTEKSTIPVKESVGRIAVQAICPCPPAIPVVIPGEKITAQAVKILLIYGIINIEVVK
ncbi:MAG: amino acid decarboxylase, partial [Eubacteriales bacterium]